MSVGGCFFAMVKLFLIFLLSSAAGCSLSNSLKYDGFSFAFSDCPSWQRNRNSPARPPRGSGFEPHKSPHSNYSTEFSSEKDKTPGGCSLFGKQSFFFLCVCSFVCLFVCCHVCVVVGLFGLVVFLRVRCVHVHASLCFTQDKPFDD